MVFFFKIYLDTLDTKRSPESKVRLRFLLGFMFLLYHVMSNCLVLEGICVLRIFWAHVESTKDWCNNFLTIFAKILGMWIYVANKVRSWANFVLDSDKRYARYHRMIQQRCPTMSFWYKATISKSKLSPTSKGKKISSNIPKCSFAFCNRIVEYKCHKQQWNY